ncbi:erg24, C-14 sterol reductase [Tilletia horrida]|uniref:Delta(14)-sterol reductase ERG24 n=1 Tax=Tilletia horrida TaxID=155126 RepID=A0AAN6JKL2_9BASI|nr:erg24, C-14 sterol reductase [Tilletia horrida]
MPAASKNIINPKTEHTEFGGTPGALFVSTSVPFITYYLFYACNEAVGCPLLPAQLDFSPIFTLLRQGVLDTLTDSTGWALYFGWYAFTVLAWAVLPGKWVPGTVLRNGDKLEYKINAMATFVAAGLLAAGWIAVLGVESFTVWYDHWPTLVTASLANAFTQAVYCYVSSFGQGKLTAAGGNTGNPIFDWFIGRELNPRIGSFDIKSFNELRPGLILWAVLDISCACKQYVRLNGRITDSMVLVVIFHAWYVVDALYNESAILTTMDITTDGFGFMLSVGDLTWVPFVYSLQARYLAFHPLDLGLLGVLGVLAVNLTGYYIFRSANGEKDQFRRGLNPKNLQFMTTSSGRKLLTSGWWGRSRHPNYFGDLVMALAWSLPTGFETPITYFYVAYFTVLLVHRQMRDDEACKGKYGKDWHVYCSKVPYRIVPYVY